MRKRTYTPMQRRVAVDEGRERILAAARELLRLDDIASFSLDAVARRAGVTRMTVYNQFGSKAGLLEEVFDLLIQRGAFSQIGAALAEDDAAAAFDVFVGVLGRFYTENQQVLDALSAAAGSDPDLDAAMERRHARRRGLVEQLIARTGKDYRPVVPQRELANAVEALLIFGTFRAIAGPGRAPSDVVPVIRQLVRATIGAPPAARKRRAPAMRRRKP